MSGPHFSDFSVVKVVGRLELERAWCSLFSPEEGQTGTRGLDNNSVSLNVPELDTKHEIDKEIR